eukprot:g1349.t1
MFLRELFIRFQLQLNTCNVTNGYKKQRRSYMLKKKQTFQPCTVKTQSTKPPSLQVLQDRLVQRPKLGKTVQGAGLF